MISARRGLLIGNSRWHWADPVPQGWQFRHTLPQPSQLGSSPVVWAAVGQVPDQGQLDPEQRVVLSDVPLPGCPPWLGVDRALGAWAAWRISQQMALDLSGGLLLVDAGTVLSQTLLTQQGAFQGGQLMPGLRLQLKAMNFATQALPIPTGMEALPSLFPQSTCDAMVRGAIQAMVTTVVESIRRTGACAWICGGDAEVLADQIDRTGEGVQIRMDRDLVMKGLVDLIRPIRSDRDH